VQSQNELVDGFGRIGRKLRISVTDRCNMRCMYCMPYNNPEWFEDDNILSYDEIVKLTHIFVRLGVEKIRVTGGEPTVRPKIEGLISALSEINGIYMVVIKGWNDDEVVDFAKFARNTGHVVRFIEFMPLDGTGIWRPDLVVSKKEMIDIIDNNVMNLVPLHNNISEPATLYSFADGKGTIGFIPP
jgi:molybdenum cofactor biosynthesis enzyme MoaA